MRLISFSPKNSSARSHCVCCADGNRMGNLWPALTYRWYVAKLEFKPRASGVCDTNPELLRLNWDVPVHHAAFPYRLWWLFPSEGQIAVGRVLSPTSPYRGDSHTIPNHKLSLPSMPTSSPLLYSNLLLISRLGSTSQVELDKSSIFLCWTT